MKNDDTLRFILLWGVLLPIFSLSFGMQTVHITEDNGSIRFVLYATLHSPKGNVKEFQGNFSWEEEKGLSGVTGALVIPASALDTKNRSRDKKMYEYSLETAKFPLIIFGLDSIVNLPNSLDKDTTYAVTLEGKMTIKNVTQMVHLPVNLLVSNKQIHISGTHRLNWKDYNVNDPSNFFLKVDKIMKIDWDISIPNKLKNQHSNASL